ncbi:MAG: hypothetical protein M0R74_18605 [Dehalococcoidia bacterium]|jgi:glycine cleavage system regulatory protein|nr:hypothetical protein [Dehalococcoidia bacterium]
MSKIPIHDAYGRIVGYDQDSTAFGKLDLDMEDHGHLINEATEHIDKLNSEITRLTRELAKEQIRYAEMEHKWMKENLDLGMQLAEARKEIERLKESETITVSVNSMINEGE